MTDLNQIAKEIAELDVVASASVWNDRRVYVNLVGFDRSFAGDRNTKVFFDPKTGWNADLGKGTTSRKFYDSLEALRAHIAA